MRFIKQHLSLVLVLVFCFGLRLWGINYGLPFFFINDERALIYGALKMLELKTLIPALHPEAFQVLNYPPVMSYVYALLLAPVMGVQYFFSGVSSLSDFKQALALDSSFIFLSGRIVNAGIGVLQVLVIYLLTLKLTKDKLASLFAAVFLGLSFYHLQLSHVTRHWLPAVFFVYLAWWFTIKIYVGEAKLKYYVLVGICSALAFGTNMSAGIAIVPLLLLHFGRYRSEWRRLLLCLGAFVVLSGAIVALHPYGLTLGEGQANATLSVMERFGRIFDKSFVELIQFFGFYFSLLIRYETMLLLFALIGGYLWFRQDRRFVAIALAFVGLYFLFFFYLFNILPRAVLMILPLLAVLAGIGLAAVFRRVQTQCGRLKIFPGVFLALVFLLATLLAVRYDFLLTQTDTRVVALSWVEQNIPSGSKIVAYLPYLPLPNSKSGIERMQTLDPNSLRARDVALLSLSETEYPVPSYDVLNLHLLDDKKVEVGLDYRYLIVEYRRPDRLDLPTTVLALIGDKEPVERFAGYGERALDIRDEIDAPSLWLLFQVERFGPFVEVYDLYSHPRE